MVIRRQRRIAKRIIWRVEKCRADLLAFVWIRAGSQFHDCINPLYRMIEFVAIASKRKMVSPGLA